MTFIKEMQASLEGWGMAWEARSITLPWCSGQAARAGQVKRGGPAAGGLPREGVGQ
jgi:hypothetical protein